jgi:predicted AlkP superfamily phosphohydrolase/phosphomutase
MLAATEQITRICEWLLASGEWDLFLVVLGAPHRAGHYLWDLSQVDTAGTSPDTLRQLRSTVADVYQACDRSVARLVEKAPAGARTLVFAAHGMGPNSGWTDRLPSILSRLQGGESSGLDLAYRLKRALPPLLRRALAAALPPELRDRVRAPWQVLRGHWKETRWFPLLMDQAGYLRVNLIGRERHGIVAAGEEYDRLCEELAAMLYGVRELTSGAPIVDRIHKIGDLAPPDAPYRDLLPDLVITWGGVSAIGSPGVRLPGGAEVRWKDPVKLPSGRAGNHRGRGWFVAAGGGIPAARGADHDLVDLVPTLTSWLGVPCPAGVQGRPIPELTGTHRSALNQPKAES